ncbi:hypothetical protein CWATWH8502_425 [Crocosphaera watsonii WH 8502]|uniref:Uncharacterized protein n=1 Tax=Crocosphaera watsonii WH 8502 TaxID=423474 RepID=T2IJK3_CROWT|nr:hypothetical protein CWATWH8502_425 [Crocosphaera watsonii WH 8502]
MRLAPGSTVTKVVPMARNDAKINAITASILSLDWDSMPANTTALTTPATSAPNDRGNPRNRATGNPARTE